MLTEEEMRARAAQASEAVGHRVRVVYEPSMYIEPEVYGDGSVLGGWWTAPRYSMAARVRVGDVAPEFGVVAADEGEEYDDERWARAARALRMAIMWEQAVARVEDPEAACAAL